MLKFAYGIDACSVFKSISTKDFWQGSTRADDWITLDRESPNFTAFTQFLAPDIKPEAKAFRILKITDHDKLYIFFEYSFKPAGFLRSTQNFKDELLSILRNAGNPLLVEPSLKAVNELAQKGRVRLCLISTKRALDAAKSDIEVSEQTIDKTLRNTIFEEIFFLTKKLFASPGAIFSEDIYEIKVAALINPDVEDELLKEQLALEYANIIGSEAAKKIVILTAGYSSIGEEILDYLLRG